jgi:hypothetical protein
MRWGRFGLESSNKRKDWVWLEMGNKGSLRVLAIPIVTLVVCCLSVVALGLHCFAQRKLAASRPLNAGYHFGPNNFKIDSLVGSAVFSRDDQTDEQSMKLLIQQSNPVHLSQLVLLAQSSAVDIRTNAIHALKQLKSPNVSTSSLEVGK